MEGIGGRSEQYLLEARIRISTSFRSFCKFTEIYEESFVLGGHLSGRTLWKSCDHRVQRSDLMLAEPALVA